MRCPICGAKMVQKQFCQYCNITDDQVLNASNKKVKEYRKTDKADLIYTTNIWPKDIGRWQLILFTIFFGLFGVNHYYVKRNKRATFSLVTTILCLAIYIFTLVIIGARNSLVFNIIFELIFYAMAFNVIMWFFDMFSLVTKSFKVPVVLAEKEQKK